MATTTKKKAAPKGKTVTDDAAPKGKAVTDDAETSAAVEAAAAGEAAPQAETEVAAETASAAKPKKATKPKKAASAEVVEETPVAAEAVAEPKPKKPAKSKKAASATIVEETPVVVAAPVVEAASVVELEAASGADVATASDVDIVAPPAKKKKKKTVVESQIESQDDGEAVAGPANAAEAVVAARPVRVPKVFPKRVDAPPAPPPPFPATEYAVVEKLLVGFLRSEVRKVGLTRAVLGLSGGVDSAVSAAIAARALGAENVLGVMMPYQSSSPESLADANEVAASLGIETVVVDITTQIDTYFAGFADASRLRRGNKMARERMTILYDHSAAGSALVIGTSNKTELLLGYGTLYGDMASALNPIGDLYKSQVWGLARHLGLPASVIEKAPTADLWSGQTDETELGFSYHTVDQLLYRMIDDRCSNDELADMGFDAAFVERISRMVRSSQFKRRLPIIAKLSARSIDTDFRYSRDWGL